MAAQEKTYIRFTLSQRLEHWVMTISFIILAITGLPQRYALATPAEWAIEAMGGIETVRIIHRAAAIIFILVTFYHFFAVAYRIYVKRTRLTMLPVVKDATDLLDSVRYNLGMAVQHPRLPRYTFAEKMEYWSIIWGSVLMVITGFMLWNPIATTKFLPGEFIPAAKTAHSAEALLAVLAIIIWHFYFVHLKTFNRAMLTGKVTHEQMHEEHAAELAEIEAGLVQPPVARETKRRRERVFLPVVGVLALVAIGGLYSFLTLEQTAITTVPTAETAQAFVRATPTPTRTPRPTPTPAPTPTGGAVAAVAAAPLIPHALDGREDCLACHSLNGPLSVPPSHEAYPTSTCLVCHSTESEQPLPAAIKHSLEGRDNCLTCHALDLLPESHQAAEFTNDNCLICHTTETGTAMAETAESGEASSGAAPASAAAIPHPLDGMENCLMCHGPEGMKPFPESHASWPDSTCLNCHAPQGEQPQPSPAITHELEGRENCTMCHQLENLPQNHQEAQFTNDNCLSCHGAPEAAGQAGAAGMESETMAPASNVSFANDLLPLFEAHCAQCHGPDLTMANLEVTSYETLATGGSSGPAFTPGSPDESLIVEIMQGQHPYRLVGENLQKLTGWIAAGAENN